MTDELYLSVDVEADGPVPGLYSMLSVGAALFDLDGLKPTKPVAKFYAKLKRLPGASTHPGTMAWWGRHEEAYREATSDPREPEEVMKELEYWASSKREFYDKPLVFVGYPISFDFMFVQWYCIKFLDRMPFSYSGLDIESLGMGLTGSSYMRMLNNRFPKAWRGGVRRKVPHKAIDDAINQGILLVNMLTCRGEDEEDGSG